MWDTIIMEQIKNINKTKTGRNTMKQEIQDELQTFDTNTLVEIAYGKIDMRQIAKVLLADRGVDKKGQWVGFESAKTVHNINK